MLHQIYANLELILIFYGHLFLRIIIFMDMVTASIAPDVYIGARWAHLMSALKTRLLQI